MDPVSRRWLLTGLWGLSGAFVQFRALAAQRRIPLFRIERSKNQNVVHYDLLSSGDPADPLSLDVYWRLYPGSGVREELTEFERRLAYGYSIVKRRDKGFDFGLRALPGRTLSLRLSDSSAEVVARVSGKSARLQHIYVATRETGLLPEVLYVDLFGELGNGNVIRERIAP